MRLLIERGAEVNVANVYGSTALMAAAAAGDMDSVRLLLDAGADINAKPNMNVDGFILGVALSPSPSLPGTAEEWLPLVYEELRRLAAHRMAAQLPGQTLQATALVHEVWLRLEREQKGWESRTKPAPSSPLPRRR